MDYISRELPRRFQKPTLFQCTHEQTSKQRAFECRFTNRCQFKTFGRKKAGSDLVRTGYCLMSWYFNSQKRSCLATMPLLSLAVGRMPTISKQSRTVPHVYLTTFGGRANSKILLSTSDTTDTIEGRISVEAICRRNAW